MAKTDEEKLDLLFKGLLYVGAGIAIYEIGQGIGIFDSAEDQAVEQANEEASGSATTSSPNNPLLAFNPNYAPTIVIAYNKKFAPKLFDATWNLGGRSPADYMKMAQDLYKAKANIAWGTYDDDEDAVYDVFRSITTQWQLSVLSAAFHYQFKKDLYAYLSPPNGFLNSTEMNVILKMVKNYPQYRKKP